MSKIITLHLTEEQVEDIVTALIIAQAGLLIADADDTEAQTRPIVLADRLQEIHTDNLDELDLSEYDHTNETMLSGHMSSTLVQVVRHMARQITNKLT